MLGPPILRGPLQVAICFAIACLMLLVYLDQTAVRLPDSNSSGLHQFSSSVDTFKAIIYGAIGQIWINCSGTIHNNQVLTLFPNVAYSIYALLPAGFTFMEWESNESTLGSFGTNHTTLTPTSPDTYGVLVLVPYYRTGTAEQGYSNFGGYIGGGSGISQVSGQFNVPSGLTHEGSGTDSLALWVGMGGWQLSGASVPLFQVGIWLNLTSSGNVTVSEWWYYIYAPTNPTYFCNEGAYFTSSGPTTGSYYVDIGHNSTGDWGSIESTNTYHTFKVWAAGSSCPGGDPSTYDSADWIVEDPPNGELSWTPGEQFYNPAITFSVLSFTNHSILYQPSAGEFAVPLLAQQGCVPDGSTYNLDWWPNTIGGSFTEQSNEGTSC